MIDSVKVYIFIGVLLILIVGLHTLQKYSILNEGYIDATNDLDYTQKYTKQIDDYLKSENQTKDIIERNLNPEFIGWQTNIDKTSIGKQMEALPEPTAYINALKKQNDFIDKELIDYDINKNEITKINSVAGLNYIQLSEKDLKVIKNNKNELKTAIDNINLSSLSKLKTRGIELQEKLDDIYLLVVKFNRKKSLLPPDPTTPEKFIEYEINRFAVPLWSPLEFVLKRLAKLFSVGSDGKQKYNDNESMGIAIKDMSEKTRIVDIDKFYKLMSESKGAPSIGIETFEKLFSDPMSYINLVLYLNGKFKEIDGNVNKSKEGFWGNLIEGWEDPVGERLRRCDRLL